MLYVWVFLGGGLGSVCRYGIAEGLKPYQANFPLGTLVANLLACLLLGFLSVYAAEGYLSEKQRLLWATGFCGGFSTFSTFAQESFNLGSAGAWGLALLNVLGSLVLGLVGVYWGLQLGR